MKLSKYNTVIKHENLFLLYNSYSEKFMLIQPLLKDLLIASERENNLKGLSEIHPNFYSELIESEFIINESVDELKKVKTLREKVDFNEAEFHLIINPTMNCNFKCWYCYETQIKDSKMDDEMLEKVKKLIINRLNSNKIKRFRLSWFGGEPFLFYKKVIQPLLIFSKEITNNKNIYFSSDFTTNGFLINDKMVSFLKSHNALDFQITLDGNRANHNLVRYVNKNRGSYDEILANIKLLAENSFRIKLRINYTKENLSGIIDILEDLSDVKQASKKNIIFSLNSVWQEALYDRDLVNGYIEKISEKGFSAHTNWVGNYLINSCYADKKNQATVNFNGEVFKCTARDFISDNKEGILDDNGDIIWNETFDKRMNIKFKNKPCLECSIMPICNGGCSQTALENEGKDYCTFETMGITKEEIILDKFLHTTLNS